LTQLSSLLQFFWLMPGCVPVKSTFLPNLCSGFFLRRGENGCERHVVVFWAVALFLLYIGFWSLQRLFSLAIGVWRWLKLLVV